MSICNARILLSHSAATPNHELQRTAPDVTLAAFAAIFQQRDLKLEAARKIRKRKRQQLAAAED